MCGALIMVPLPNGKDAPRMSFTEKTSTSWTARIKSALGGIIGGFILLIASVVGIFWNESNSIATYRALSEGQSMVASVPASPIDSANEGKLVHVSGDVTLEYMPVDPDTGMQADGAVALARKVEMFQWVEKQESRTEKKLGGGEETVTTYTYAKEWSEAEVSSASFKQPDGHENPPMQIKSDRFTIESGALGDFMVSGDSLASIATAKEVNATPEVAEALTTAIGASTEAKIIAGSVFIGANANRPQVGDLRVSYERLDVSQASFVARQADTALQPFTTSNGNSIFLSAAGKLDAAAMFAKARADNALFTWIIRLVCIVGLFIGFTLIFSIIGVIGDVVPLFGSILSFGTSLLALLLAITLGPALIAIAWFTARPLLSLVILALSAGAGLAVYFLRRRQPAGGGAAAA